MARSISCSSRATFASTLAQATDTQSRSALVRTLTGIPQALAPSQLCEPSSNMCAPSRATWLRMLCDSSSSPSARFAAKARQATIPRVSISSTLAKPTANPATQDATSGCIRSRVFSLKSLLSRRPAGQTPSCLRFFESISATPTATGPAIEPRPTSSMPITNRAPLSNSDCSTLRLGVWNVFEDIGIVIEPGPVGCRP